MITVSELKVWQTVRRGQYKSADELRQALDHGSISFRLNNGVDHLLDKIIFPQTEEELDLVDVDLEELGLDKDAQLQDVYRSGLGLGLELCPSDIGPKLRLQVWMLNNPRPWARHRNTNDEVLVAMEPIEGKLFLVKTGEYSERLEAVPVEHFKDRFGVRRRFVFVKPRK